MKNHSLRFRSFVFFTSLFLIFVLASCADFGSGRETGSVSFSFDSKILRNTIIRDVTTNDTGGGTYEYGPSYELTVSLKGDYTASQTLTWSYSEYEKIAVSEEKQTFSLTFEEIPVGKSVYAVAELYLIPPSYQEIREGEGKSLQMQGKSNTITIASGQNALALFVHNTYGDFPVTFTLGFDTVDEDEIKEILNYMNIFALDANSDYAKSLLDLWSAGDGYGLYQSISQSPDYDNILGMQSCYFSDETCKISASEATCTFSANLRLPVSEDDSKLCASELVFIAVSNLLDSAQTSRFFFGVSADFTSENLVTVKPKKGETTVVQIPVDNLSKEFINTPYVYFSSDADKSYSYYVKRIENGVYNEYDSYYSANVGENATDAFSFDQSGYLYVLKYDDSSYKIWSNNPKITDEIELTGLNGGQGYGIVLDQDSSELYVYTINEMTLNLVRYPNLAKKGSIEESVTYEVNYNVPQNFYHEKITVNAGALYDYGRIGSERRALVKVTLSENSKNETVDSTLDLDSEFDGASDKATISDMMYQDGNLYMLMRDFNDCISETYNMSELAYYSRGKLLKVNAAMSEVKSLGWTKDDSVASTAGIYAYYKEGNGNYEKYYKDATCETPLLIPAGFTFESSAAFPKLYVPSEANSTAGFYGPEKFIAIKPKKLIIADDGVAFYTDANGAYNMKNVNRVVTVDLETFAISSAQDVNIAFGDTAESSIFSASAFTNLDKLGLTNSVYISNGSSFATSGTATSFESVYIGIPLSE